MGKNRSNTAKRSTKERPTESLPRLYLFYLPTYSPDLNLAQTLCRKRKYEWLRPQEYLTKDELF